MAALKYRDEHNKVGFLEKSKGSTDYDQVIDFLLDSHIRSSLLLDDAGGIVDMSIAEIYTYIANLGFLQMILNIETRNTKPYRALRLTSKMFANMRLNFHGDHMPLLASMLAPAQPAIAGDSSGEAEPSVPPRPAPTNTDAQVNEPGPFFDPNFESTSTQAHDSIPDPVPSTNVKDDAFGSSFDISPPGSTKAPPAGTTSGGAADPEKLTALCSLVNSLVQKIDSQASDLIAHKLVFKEVVGKLIKKVKELEDKLKARKKKFVVTESDIEEEE
ncbi:hypothetical protein Tco_1481087, partial [Tanacetum coccineum]